MRGGVLTDTESALRTAWLTACDRTERELRALAGDRLDLPAGEPGVRTAVVRVLDEHLGAAVLAGTDLTEFEDVAALSRRHAHAIRTATGGAVGNPSHRNDSPGPPPAGRPRRRVGDRRRRAGRDFSRNGRSPCEEHALEARSAESAAPSHGTHAPWCPRDSSASSTSPER
ncbi:hypothetical protein ACTWJ9_11355 [Streptomyces sp. GDS52]|uniref:hypothetical protein n=1 Tax=Streptomyces sp. GDS52 TaxID=3406419 RepID=UPI003FD221A5